MTDKEKQLAEQVFAKEQPPSIGALEAVREGFQALLPGLSLEKFAKDVGHEVTQQVAAGAHELAAALFNHSAFVMYQRGTREDHGVHGPEHSSEETLPQERQQERGGREM